LRELIAKAVETHAQEVRIPPGVYRLAADPAHNFSHLHFEGVHDLIVDATGVSLICTEVHKASCVSLYHCKNVTLKGLTIDCEPVAFTQGKVVEIAKDYYSLAVDPGFTNNPDELPNPRPMNIFNPKNGLWKNNVDDIYIKGLAKGPGGQLRVYPVGSVQKTVAIGDAAVVPIFLSSCAVTARQSENLTYDHVTIYQSGVMAFHEDGGGGNTTLDHCLVDRKPGSGRILSTNADGFHSANIRRGPNVIGSRFRFMHDDGINIHGTYGHVLEPVGDSSARLIASTDNIQTGDTLIFVQRDTARVLGRAKVLSIKTEKGLSAQQLNDLHEPRNFGQTKLVQFDRNILIEKGADFMNLNACGVGFRIENCEFGPLRENGIVIKTWDGRVLNNRVHDTGKSGIELCGSVFSEGPFCQNILLQGNILSSIGTSPQPGCGAGIVCVNHPTLPHGSTNNDIRILENKIESTRGLGILVRNARNVLIKDNRFNQIGTRSKSELPSVAIELSENVQSDAK
jgi:hypothetical protein